MADHVEQRLGNYRLLRLLGEGGFARVYLGEHIHLGTQAAIKVLHTQLIDNDIESFRMEARTIARLIHPHIVRVLEFGVEHKTPFLVMDYAPNGTLRGRHPRGSRLPLPIIVSYVKQVANALQYAHDEKVIHRDIKPENMLLERRNVILLSDFGIALVMQSSNSKSIHSMAGTMAYMAPEQIQGKPRPASDQYSLGIVVYEWLSGNRPFHGSLTELVGQHLSAPPPTLCDKIPDIPTTVEQVILTALAKDPKERFSSVQAFATALEQAYQMHPSAFHVNNYGPDSTSQQSFMATLPSSPTLFLNEHSVSASSQSSQTQDRVIPQSQQSEPVNSITPVSHSAQSFASVSPSYTFGGPPSSVQEPARSNQLQQLPTSRPSISRRVVVIGLVGLVSVGATGGGIAWLASSSNPQVSSPPPSSTGIITRAPTAKPTATAAPSPTATATATPSPTATPLGTMVYTYSGHNAGLRALAWSPDGKRVATASDDTTAQVWDATSGANAIAYHGHSSYVEGVAWSANNAYIVSGSADGTAQVWNSKTGNHIYTYRGHIDAYTGSASQSHAWVNRVGWSPDSKYIVSCDQTSDPSRIATVQVWEATTGKTITSYRGHTNGVYAVAWSPTGNLIASAAYDETLQIWEAMTGNVVATYRGNAFLFGLSWSPDSTSVAVGSSNNTVIVFNVASKSVVNTYTGHANWVKDVAWSPDGKHIASGSDDSLVMLWDIATGANVYSFNGHSGHINGVGWSPDGKLIASGGDTVQVWTAS